MVRPEARNFRCLCSPPKLRNIVRETLIVHHSLGVLFTTVVSMSGDHCEIPQFITFSDCFQNNRARRKTSNNNAYFKQDISTGKTLDEQHLIYDVPSEFASLNLLARQLSSVIFRKFL